MSIKAKLIEQKKNGLHHAYVLVGDRNIILNDLHDFLEKDFDFNYHGNPNYFNFNHEAINADLAKEIVSFSTYSIKEGTNRIIIIQAGSIFPEAQNALLKSLEEPVFGTIFFIIVPTISNLLPTLISRTILFHDEQTSTYKFSDKAIDFLNGSYQERLGIIEEISKGLKDKKIERTELGEFVFILERKIYAEYGLSKEALSIYRVINKINQYLSISGASVKMLLEWLALSLPKVA